MGYEVRIEQRRALTLAALRHEGSFFGLPKKLRRVHDWLDDARRLPRVVRPVFVLYNTPYALKDFDLRSAAGVVIVDDGSLRPDPPIEFLELASGPHAVLSLRGDPEQIGEAFSYLIAKWLPVSGREASGEPRHVEFLGEWGEGVRADVPMELLLPLAR